MTMISSRIAALQTAWSSRHAPRASGGARSVAGFRYQFEVTLLELLRGWLRSPTNPQVLFELLSDLLSADGPTTWTITQVKRTGTSGHVALALDELWSIHQTALETDPELCSFLQYEVRCERLEVANIPKRLESWRERIAADAKVLDDFLASVLISVEPHAASEILAILANELRCKDPSAWMHEQLSRLSQDASELNAIARLELQARHAQDLFSRLAAMRNASSTGPTFRVLGAEDRAPTTVERGSYLVGGAPRIHHLRTGFFAPRPWQLSPAIDDFYEWLDRDSVGSDQGRRIPVFWIGGRSGCGKSVLLLQLAAKVNERGVGPVVWLGSRRDVLREATEWALGVSQTETQPIIVLDDPYAPGIQGDAADRWREAIAILDVARDERECVPLFLACGPTEQGIALARDFADDLQVHFWTLDDTTDEGHVEDLARWFVDRTGQSVPPSASGDVLLVQRFFEWRAGEHLGSFASRFRARVAALDASGALDAFVGSLLAANRLYAGLPEESLSELSPVARDGLARLEQDHHLALDAEDGRPGLWLTHPHLSDALFIGWFGPNAHHQKAEALGNAIAIAERHGNTAAERTGPLWAIWRAWSDDETNLARGRLDEQQTKLVLEKSFARIDSGTWELGRIPVWVNLVQIVPELSCRAAVLTRSLESLASVPVTETGCRLLCHTLLSNLHGMNPDESTACVHAIRHLLDVSVDWHEWPHVAVHLARETGTLADGQRLIDWATDRMASPMAALVLMTAIRIDEVSADATNHVLARIERAPCDRNWARLIESIVRGEIRSGSGIPESVGIWARRHVKNPMTLFVLRILIEANVDGATGLAREWIAANPSAPPANYLIEPLAARPDAGEFEITAASIWIQEELVGADRLIEWLLQQRGPHTESTVATAQAWLLRHSEARGAPFVLVKLLPNLGPVARGETIAFWHKWLDGREDRPEWAHVIQTLLDVTEDPIARRALIGRTLDWLSLHTEGIGWNYVIQKVLSVTDEPHDLEAIIHLGETWLANHEEREEWPFLLQAFLQRVNDSDVRDALLQRGIDWLSTHAARTESPYLVQNLLDLAEGSSGRNKLIDASLAWLASQGERNEWGYVFRKLLDKVSESTTRRALVRLGQDWIADHQEVATWPHILLALIEARPDAETIKALNTAGFDWLPGRAERPEWTHVLRTLIDTADDHHLRHDLIQTGVAWLVNHENRSEWPHVLMKLMDVVDDASVQRSLIEAGLSWLPSREARPEWPYLFQKLCDATIDSESHQRLVAIGLTWLPGREHRKDWIFTFRKALGVAANRDSQRELITAGFAWLRGHEERAEWPGIVRLLLDYADDTETRDELARHGLVWLSTHPDGDKSLILIRRLLDVARDPQVLAELVCTGVRWLPGHEQRKEWNYLLQQLLRLAADPAVSNELIRRGLDWLDSRSEHPGRAPVIRSLNEAAATLGSSLGHASAIRLAELMRNSDYWCERSIVSQRAGNYGDAVDAARKAIAIDAQNRWAWRLLAINLEQDGRFSEAQVAWRRFDELSSDIHVYQSALDAELEVLADPSSMTAWRVFATRLHRLGRGVYAIEIAKQELATDPSIHAALVPVLEETLSQHPVECAQLLDRMLEVAPREAHYLNLLGVAEGKAGNGDRSVVYLRAAAAASPGNPTYWYCLGHALEHGDEAERAEARIAFDQALSLSPGYEKARSGLARLGSQQSTA